MGLPFRWLVSSGMVCIHLAAEAGDLETVERLLVSDASLANGVAATGWSVLMDATYEGHTHVVRSLLNAGADLGHLSPSGHTCLFLASTRGHVDLVGLLLSRGAEMGLGRSPLHAAAGAGHADVLQALLSHLPDTAEWQEQLSGALLEASACGCTDAVRVLLQHGADWGRRDEQGHTPLMNARAWNHAGCTRLLEEAERAYELAKARALHDLQLARMWDSPLFPSTSHITEWPREGDYKRPSLQGEATTGQQAVMGADSPSSELEGSKALRREADVLALSLDALSGDMFTELMELVGVTTGCPQ